MHDGHSLVIDCTNLRLLGAAYTYTTPYAWQVCKSSKGTCLWAFITIVLLKLEMMIYTKGEITHTQALSFYWSLSLGVV